MAAGPWNGLIAGEQRFTEVDGRLLTIDSKFELELRDHKTRERWLALFHAALGLRVFLNQHEFRVVGCNLDTKRVRLHAGFDCFWFDEHVVLELSTSRSPTLCAPWLRRPMPAYDGQDCLYSLAQGQFVLVNWLWPKPFAWFVEQGTLVVRDPARGPWLPSFRRRPFCRDASDAIASRTRRGLEEQAKIDLQRARWDKQERNKRRKL